MISTFCYRIVQGVGWLALLCAHGVVLGTIVAQSIRGPGPDGTFLPSTGLIQSLGNSLVIGGGAALIALAIGAPAACVLAQGRRSIVRVGIAALMLIAILTMPSMHAYAWQLLLTSPSSLVQWFNQALSAVGHWGARGMSAWVLGMWLWPIPAWAIVDGLQRSGAEALELALLDARPAMAMWRGVLPLLRGPIVSATAIVFVVAALDAVVSPLMLASDVWSVEMVRQAELAMASPRPAGDLFWRSWPMLAVIIILTLCALPGLRRILAWHSGESAPREVRRFGGRAFAGVAGGAAAVASLLPAVVFVAMLATDERYTILGAVASVWPSARGPAGATAIVAMLVVGLSFAIAVTCALAMRGSVAGGRWTGRAIVAATIVTAVLPASLVATSAVSFYASPALGDAAGWNIYDDTPIAWTASLLARYAFVPVCMAIVAGWTAPRSLVDQAETDGATRFGAWLTGRWPFVRGAVVVGSLAAGLLAFTEVQASLLAKAPRWGDDSIAVYLDSQMHFGRHGQTLALALLMYAPILAACLMIGLRRRRSGRGARQ